MKKEIDIEKAVEHVKVRKNMMVDELVKEMNKAGVMGGGKLAKSVDVVEAMVKDKDCKVFFGLAGAMVPGGMRQIVVDMLEQNLIDVFVTTGANLTHDLIESLGEQHYVGDEKFNDKELHEKGIDRIYNVFMKNQVYKKLENFFEKNWLEIKKCKNIKELAWKLGELVDGKGILGICWKKKIPVFCPAIADSGIGLMIWGRLVSDKKISIDAFDDMKEILDIAWTAKKTGVIYIGGGVPKNFIQQSMQFTKGASYGVQITTDRAEPGGSSGAPLREGISWGKLNEKAKFIDVFCDATIALPIIYSVLKERI